MRYYTGELSDKELKEASSMERAILNRAIRGANITQLIKACRPYFLKDGTKMYANSLKVAEIVDGLVGESYLMAKRR